MAGAIQASVAEKAITLTMRRACAGAILLLSLAVWPAQAAEVLVRTFPLAWGGTVAVENVYGSIQVEGWDKAAVEIIVIQAEGARSARIEVEADPAALAIRTRYPAGSDEPAPVEYWLRVPRQVALQALTTINGSIRVERVEGSVEAVTVNGDIELNGVAGAIVARTVNGTIGAALRGLAALPVPVELESVNGNLWLGLAPRLAAEVEMRTITGGFDSEFPLVASASEPDTVRAVVGQGGPRLHLETVRGHIHLFRIETEL